MKKFQVLVVCDATAYKTVEVLAENAKQAAKRAEQMAGMDTKPWKLSDEFTSDPRADQEDAVEMDALEVV